MGQKPRSWDDFPAMVEQVKALLRSEDVEIDGELTRMLYWPTRRWARPIEVMGGERPPRIARRSRVTNRTRADGL
jgi:hypothetical protein